MLRLHAPSTENELGSVHAAVLVDSSALALLGTAPRPLPKKGTAMLADCEDGHGQWHAVSWTRPDDDRVGFFAILGVETITQLHAGNIRLSHGTIGASESLPAIGRVDLDSALLLDALEAVRLMIFQTKQEVRFP